MTYLCIILCPYTVKLLPGHNPLPCRLEPARGLNRRFRRGKRGRIILARSAIAVKERIEGLKKKVEGSYAVQLDHYAPVVLSCKLERAGPQMSKATPGRLFRCVPRLVLLECPQAFGGALDALSGFFEGSLAAGDMRAALLLRMPQCGHSHSRRRRRRRRWKICNCVPAI